VRAYLGTGTGTLTPVTAPPTNLAGGWVALADFNLDGRPDVAATRHLHNQLFLFAGNGDGTFQSPTTMTVGQGNLNVAAADFNGDQIPDLIVLDLPLNAFSFLQGAGDGTFAAPMEIPSGANNPTGIAVADFNGDGTNDVAVAHRQDESVSVRLGNGDGTFQSPRLFSSGLAEAILASDLNRDGFPDLVVSVFNGVRIFLGTGDGTFSPAASFVLGFFGPFNAVSTDLDQDGIQDLAVGSRFEDWTALLKGNGDGTFQSPVLWPSTDGNRWILAGDFNADAFPDLAADFELGFSVVLNDRAGRFVLAPSYGGPSGRSALAAADFDEDGDLDLLFGYSSDIGEVVYLAGLGNGSFAPSVYVTSAVVPSAFAVADLNGDGHLDAAATGGGVSILLGNGNGTFRLTAQYTGGGSSIATSDFDRDGTADLVVAGTTSGQLSLFQGVGDGTFLGPVALDVGGTSVSVVTGDVNGDAKPDILVGTWNGVSVRLGYGDGTFRAPDRHGMWWSPSWVTLGDFGPDGKLDFAVAHFDSSQIEIYSGNGDGTFRAPRLHEAAEGPGALVAADWNRDGSVDLAVVTRGASGVTLLMNSAGSFERRLHYRRRHRVYAPPYGLDITPGDFNGNGKVDMAITDGTGVAFEIFLNTTCEPRRLAVDRQPSSCNVPGAALAVQPTVGIYDDGDNRVTCGSEAITTSLVAGPPGAVLAGTTVRFSVAGTAQFTDLALDVAGPRYRLEFSHPALGRTRSRSFTEGLTAAILGVGTVCMGSASAVSFQSEGLWESYLWKLDGIVVGRTRGLVIPVPSLGSHTIELTVVQDGCAATTSRTLMVAGPTPSSTVSAPATVCPYAADQIASVPDAGPGAIYHWAIQNGAITSGADSRQITFRAGPFGNVLISATVSRSDGCSSASGENVAIDPSPSCPPPVGFFTVPPCRLLDTRLPGPFGAPPLAAGEARTVSVLNRCGLPATAKALSLNVTATAPSHPGYVTIFPGSTPFPPTSTVNYRPGQTRANNAIIPVGAAGDLTVSCGQLVGTVHVILDVTGYFE
jgi:hypothetical protein